LGLLVRPIYQIESDPDGGTSIVLTNLRGSIPIPGFGSRCLMCAMAMILACKHVPGDTMAITGTGTATLGPIPTEATMKDAAMKVALKTKAISATE
jgi:hypothetical protein